MSGKSTVNEMLPKTWSFCWGWKLAG